MLVCVVLAFFLVAFWSPAGKELTSRLLCLFCYVTLPNMSWSTLELGVGLAPWGWFGPSGRMFYWLFQGGTSFVDLLCFCSVLCLLCLCARLFICALWSPAGGRLLWAGLLALVCGVYCDFVTFPLVSWVRCGTWLYRFLIFAPLLTLSKCIASFKKVKVLRVIFISHTLPYSFCACVRNTPKIVMFFHWKDDNGVFKFIFRGSPPPFPPPLDPRRPLDNDMLL